MGTRSPLPNAIPALAGRLWQMGGAFLVTLVLARALSVEAFGAYQYAMTVQGFWLLFSEMGLAPWTVKTVAADPSRRASAWANGLVLRALFAVAGFLVLSGLALSGHLPHSGLTLTLLALSLPMLLGLWPVFDAAGQTRIESLTSSIRVAVQLALVLLAFQLAREATPLMAVLAYGGAVLVGGVLEWVFYIRLFRHDPQHPKVTRATVIATLRDSWPLAASQFMIRIYFFADTIILQAFHGDAKVALYNAAYKVMMLFQQVGGVFARVSLPILSADVAAQRDYLRRWQGRLLGISGALTVMGMAAAPWLVRIFGEQYREASNVLVWLMPNIVASWINGLWGGALLGRGEDRYYMKTVSAAAVANLALNLVFIPRFGMVGAAATTLASEWIVLICFYLRLRRVLGIRLLG